MYMSQYFFFLPFFCLSFTYLRGRCCRRLQKMTHCQSFDVMQTEKNNYDSVIFILVRNTCPTFENDMEKKQNFLSYLLCLNSVTYPKIWRSP